MELKTLQQDEDTVVIQTCEFKFCIYDKGLCISRPVYMTVLPLSHYGEGKMVEFSFLALGREHGDEPGRVYLLIVREGNMEQCTMKRGFLSVGRRWIPVVGSRLILGGQMTIQR